MEIDFTNKASIEEISEVQVNSQNSIGGGCYDLLKVATQDCSCHEVHAPDGCTHPESIYEWVEVECPGGSSGGSGDGTGTGSGSDTGTGGSGGSSGGDGGDNNIPTIPINPDGSSAAPSFLINALGGEGQLTSLQINWINDEVNSAKVNQLLSVTHTSTPNGIMMALSALMSDSNIAWSLIEDWFLNTPDFEEPNLNINPDDITYDVPLTQQELPSFGDFIKNFPKWGTEGNYSQMPASNVYYLVGGSLLNSYRNNPNAYSNACSIRGSRGLLYSGVNIPVLNYPGIGQRTQKGEDNKNYILDAVSFDKFMRDKFGPANHELKGTDANDATLIANLLKGKNGIYVIINNSHAQAGYSGHVDAIINGNCIGNAYTSPIGGVKSIRIWELKK